MEIDFIFYKKSDENAPFFSKWFDTRGGLNIIMRGFDHMEVDEPHRLLYQMEKALDFELSLLDYWNDKVHNQFLSIPPYIEFLEQFLQKLTNHPTYYQQIEYKYIPNNFLETELLLTIQSLIDFFKHYQEEGSIIFKMKAV